MRSIPESRHGTSDAFLFKQKNTFSVTHRLGRTAVLLVPLILQANASADDGETRWQVFVTDHDTPTITALDLDQPNTRWSFDVDGPGRLFATPSGNTLVAVQTDDDRVSFLDAGIALDRHGDHADIEAHEPALIAGGLSGPGPFHVVTHDGTVATNFDRGGYVALLTEADILEGDLTAERFEQNHPHHGFAVPMGPYIVSSIASDETMEEDELSPRIGLAAYERDGTMIGAMATCTDLHDEAFSGSYLATGCAEGILTLRDVEGEPELGLLPYPDDFPPETTGSLLGVVAVQMFLGDYGDDALVIVDPEETPHFRRVEVPFRHVDFVLDPARPQFAYVLTEDGSLHRLDLLSARVEQSATVTRPYSMDGDGSDPRPRLAVAGDRVVVTDPLAQVLHVVDGADLTMADDIPLAGLPYDIVAVGGSGLTH